MSLRQIIYSHCSNKKKQAKFGKFAKESVSFYLFHPRYDLFKTSMREIYSIVHLKNYF